jgi:hypothetical protein
VRCQRNAAKKSLRVELSTLQWVTPRADFISLIQGFWRPSQERRQAALHKSVNGFHHSLR